MPIDRFAWTSHALLRLRQRGLTMAEVEAVVAARHGNRELNAGPARWLVRGTTQYGAAFEVVYDQPHLVTCAALGSSPSGGWLRT